jgi:hypothetical protein
MSILALTLVGHSTCKFGVGLARNTILFVGSDTRCVGVMASRAELRVWFGEVACVTDAVMRLRSGERSITVACLTFVW